MTFLDSLGLPLWSAFVVIGVLIVAGFYKSLHRQGFYDELIAISNEIRRRTRF